MVAASCQPTQRHRRLSTALDGTDAECLAPFTLRAPCIGRLVAAAAGSGGPALAAGATQAAAASSGGLALAEGAGFDLMQVGGCMSAGKGHGLAMLNVPTPASSALHPRSRMYTLTPPLPTGGVASRGAAAAALGSSSQASAPIIGFNRMVALVSS